jgi:O-antigen ligase
LRATGLYICPNHLAGYLEVTADHGLEHRLLEPDKRSGSSCSAAYGTIICAIGHRADGSRGGYVSTFVGVLVFAVLSFLAIRRAQRQQLWISAVSAIVVTIVMFASVTLCSHATIRCRPASRECFTGGGDARLDLWKAAISQSKMNPVVGTGSGHLSVHSPACFAPRSPKADPVLRPQ